MIVHTKQFSVEIAYCYILFLHGKLGSTYNTTVALLSSSYKAASKVARCDLGQPRREEREGGRKDRREVFLRAKVINEASALFKLLWYTGERGEKEGTEGKGERERERKRRDGGNEGRSKQLLCVLRKSHVPRANSL